MDDKELAIRRERVDKVHALLDGKATKDKTRVPEYVKLLLSHFSVMAAH